MYRGQGWEVKFHSAPPYTFGSLKLKDNLVTIFVLISKEG